MKNSWSINRLRLGLNALNFTKIFEIINWAFFKSTAMMKYWWVFRVIFIPIFAFIESFRSFIIITGVTTWLRMIFGDKRVTFSTFESWCKVTLIFLFSHELIVKCNVDFIRVFQVNEHIRLFKFHAWAYLFEGNIELFT